MKQKHEMSKQGVGFIGTGLMGHGIAKNLVTKGWPLKFRVNRNRDDIGDLMAAGAVDAQTNADCATDTDIVFLCVTGGGQVEQVMLGENVFHVGPPGSGNVLKLVNNFISPAQIAALAEGYAAAAKAGVDLRHYTHLTETMPLPSPVAEAVPQSFVPAAAMGVGDKFTPSMLEMQEKLNRIRIVLH